MGKKGFSVIIYILILFSIQEIFPEIDNNNQFNIYLIHGFNYIRKGDSDFNTKFVSLCYDQKEFKLNIMMEFPGYEELANNAEKENVYNCLSAKTKKYKADVVIGLLPEANKFIYLHRDNLFKNSKKIYMIPGKDIINNINDHNDSYIIQTDITSSIRNTIKLIFTLFPKTHKIIVINGVGENDKLIISYTRSILEEIKVKSQIEYFIGDSQIELIQKLKNIQSNTVVLYTLMTRDKYNNYYHSSELLKNLSKHCDSPIFGYFETQIGSGILGGNMVTSIDYASKTFYVTMEMLRDKKSSTISMPEQFSSYLFDWRELKKQKINESQLPKGSRVFYKPLSFWGLYKNYIIAGIIIITVQLIFIIFLIFLVGKQKRTETALQKSLAHIKSISSNLTSGMIYQIVTKKNIPRRFTFLSDSVKELYGITPEDAIKDPALIYSRILDYDIKTFRNAENEAIKTLSTFKGECRVKNPDGTIRWSSYVSTPTVIDNDTVRWDGIEFVITERKLAEQNLQHALNEKEILIHELYHRTKNTLQIIRSLLVLHAEDFPDNVDLQKLVKDTEIRILVISMVHNMLFKSRDLSQISIKNYIKELSSLILKSFGLDNKKIKIKINIPDKFFHIDTAIPFGIIINELMTNSLKYAFPDERNGLITINLSSEKSGKNILHYSDNGIGVPEGFDFRNQKTLGLNLIYNIGESQLSGKVIMENNNGINCIIEFYD
ncbi:MAG: PAS domain-containing protein [Spirochaetes bacterium]|nr:PAS domain-containing protein [Spirochaetota bacterium]